MRGLGTLWSLCALAACLMLEAHAAASLPEYNPVRRQPVSIGPEANRIIVGFRTTLGNAVAKTVHFQRRARSVTIVQAQTNSADVAALVRRAGLTIARSRQFTPSMHVLFLPKTLYGADVSAALARLRADPAVQFADVDEIRYPLLVPTNPLFAATPGTAAGQWYMNTPGPVTVEGVQTTDYSATDAVSAWNITTGSPGIVIADVDTGILFGHPDLLRAGLGGRLLPGFDFVSQDENPATGAPLGTFDIANDGDGWDPDPSDPGDWISQADIDNPNGLFAGGMVGSSSWHGTRVVGVFGAITDNDIGTAGMTWGNSTTPGPWALPVRALGKGGGYDSDIIAGIEWAAGLPVTDTADSTAVSVPDNPYPADIINLSLGGESTCPSSYQTALSTVTSMGVLVVASAGNSVSDVSGTSSVEAPANCSSTVSGVLAVAGLRNVGTKVGYSSSGPEVGISAPAGNCINSSGACLRSIETTTDLGTTSPLTGSGYSYTNELSNADDSSPNLGTSFSAPIVSGIAALMRSVNDNLTPAQIIARMQTSANAFPANTGNLPTCPTLDSNTDQCSCLSSNQCGAGMVDAYTAVQAAQKPIAAVAISGSSLNASGSAASCGRTVASYAWAAGGGVTVTNGSGATTSVAGSGTVSLTVTDNLGGTDTATVTVNSGSASSSAPTAAGSAACPAALSVTPIPPTVAQAFSPASVGPTIASTLTFTFKNTNGYALTQSNFSDTLPSGVTFASTPTPATTCTGANVSVSATSSTVTLSDANIPAHGSCTLTASVSSSRANTYTNTISANALTTGPAGANTDTSSSTLTVTAPVPPTIAEGFSPASVTQNASSTLTITLKNSNAYALTAVGLSDMLPTNLTAKSSPAATTTCGGTLPTPSGSITLSGATIPASGSCTVTVTVGSATADTYSNSIGAGAVTYTPTGATTSAVTATLTVTASSSGGGALDWTDILCLACVLLAVKRKPGSLHS